MGVHKGCLKHSNILFQPYSHVSCNLIHSPSHICEFESFQNIIFNTKVMRNFLIPFASDFLSIEFEFNKI
jgi:hypothetical protein